MFRRFAAAARPIAINSDVTSRQVLGGLTARERLDDPSRARIVERPRRADSRARSSSRRRLGGRETRGPARGIDARSRASAASRGSRPATSRASDSTFADPAPPFGTAFDDAVTATGMTAHARHVGRRAARFSVRFGGEARGARRRVDDARSDGASLAAPVGRVGFGAVLAAPRRSQARLDADLSARVDESSLIGDAVVSPRGAVAVARGPLVASASIGNGYSPPSLADQFFHEGVLVRANPALRPERTTGDVEARTRARTTWRRTARSRPATPRRFAPTSTG